MRGILCGLICFLFAPGCWALELTLTQEGPRIDFTQTMLAHSHEVRFTLYLPETEVFQIPRIREELSVAQTLLDDCGIRLSLDRLQLLRASEDFLDYESLAFHGNAISPHERIFFAALPARSSGLLFVRSLDWTIGDDGTTAVGYGSYIADLAILSSSDEHYLLGHMAGHAVLGRARGASTLAHEIGHAFLGLAHVSDPTSIMSPYGFARSPKARFTPAECAKGRGNFPWVRPLASADPGR